jgi:hypothetical protein
MGYLSSSVNGVVIGMPYGGYIKSTQIRTFIVVLGGG